MKTYMKTLLLTLQLVLWQYNVDEEPTVLLSLNVSLAKVRMLVVSGAGTTSYYGYCKSSRKKNSLFDFNLKKNKEN